MKLTTSPSKTRNPLQAIYLKMVIVGVPERIRLCTPFRPEFTWQISELTYLRGEAAEETN